LSFNENIISFDLNIQSSHNLLILLTKTMKLYIIELYITLK